MSDERSHFADIFLGAVPPVPEEVTASLFERTFTAPPDAGGALDLLPAGEPDFGPAPDVWAPDLDADPPIPHGFDAPDDDPDADFFHHHGDLDGHD